MAVRSVPKTKGVTTLLIGAAVLALASGASNASAGAVSARSLEIARLQQTWGTRVVSDAAALQGTQAILVGTRSRLLLRSASPQRWLGARFPVIVMYAGSSRIAEDECGSMGMHSTRDHLPN